MKASKPPVLTHHWAVSGTIPNPDQRYPNYGSNVYVGVEAKSMQDAIKAALELYPGMTLMSCVHRGEVHVRSLP